MIASPMQTDLPLAAAGRVGCAHVPRHESMVGEAHPTRAITQPPSERDYEVYGAVVIEGVSTREVARHFGISQTRVRQLVQRVVRWLAAVLPAEAADLPPESALLAAQTIAAERLDNLYGAAMECWRSTTQTKFASLAARLAVARSRLPVAGSIAGRLAEAAGAIDEELPLHAPSGAEPAPAPAAAFAPPAGDCSAFAAESPRNPYKTFTPAADISPAIGTTACLHSTFDSSLPREKPHADRSAAAAHPLLTPAAAPQTAPTNLLTPEETEDLLRRAFRTGRKPRRARS